MSLAPRLHVIAAAFVDVMLEAGHEHDADLFQQAMEQYAQLAASGAKSLPAPDTGHPQMDALIQKILQDLASENIQQTAANAGQHVGQGRGGHGHNHGGYDHGYGHGGGYGGDYYNQPWYWNYWYSSWYPYYWWNQYPYPYVGGSKQHHKHHHSKKVGQAMGLLEPELNRVAPQQPLRVLPPGPGPVQPCNNRVNAGLGDIQTFNMNCNNNSCTLNLTFRRNRY